MNRRRLLVIIVIITLVVVSAAFLLMRRQQAAKDILVSEVTVENVQGISSLSHQKNNFYTGTAIASIELGKSGPYKSTLATGDTPFSQTFKYDYSESTSTLLAQILYTKQDLYQITGLAPQPEPQQVWVTQAGTQPPKLFDPFGGTRKILDARFTSSGFVLLANETDSTNTLFVFDGSLKEIKKGVSDNQILGVFNGSVVTRQLNGESNVYNLSSGDERSIESSSDSVVVDENTSSILQLDKGKLLVDKDNEKNSIRVSGTVLSASKGYAYVLDKAVLPTKIEVVNLQTMKKQTFNTSFKNQAIIEGITGVVTIDPSTSTFGLVTESDSLLLASTDTAAISKIESYEYPYFKDPGLINYDLGTNQAVIYSTNIPESLAILGKDCGCDLNQIDKFWQKSFDSNPYQPTLGEPEEEEEGNF